MPVPQYQGVAGQPQISCWQKMKMGLLMGVFIGCASGAIIGTATALGLVLNFISSSNTTFLFPWHRVLTSFGRNSTIVWLYVFKQYQCHPISDISSHLFLEIDNILFSLSFIFYCSYSAVLFWERFIEYQLFFSMGLRGRTMMAQVGRYSTKMGGSFAVFMTVAQGLRCWQIALPLKNQIDSINWCKQFAKNFDSFLLLLCHKRSIFRILCSIIGIHFSIRFWLLLFY